MLDPFFRQDSINKGNFFHSVPVENLKTDHSIIYVISPCCVELDLSYLHKFANFQYRCQLIHNALSSILLFNPLSHS